MVETKLHSSQGSKIVREAQPQNEQTKRELIILTGITTSQINQALKADDSYPSRVFLKVEGYEQDIPVFFRLIDFKEQKEKKWERPKIKPNSLIECKGCFGKPKNGSTRPSFTAYSYTLLACPQDLQNKSILDGAKSRYPDWKKLVHEYGRQVDYLTKEQELEKIKSHE